MMPIPVDSASDDSNATEVMTTVVIHGEPKWLATTFPGDPTKLLLQDADLNIGFVGTHKQLVIMCAKMHQAISAPINLTDMFNRLDAKEEVHHER